MNRRNTKPYSNDRATTSEHKATGSSADAMHPMINLTINYAEIATEITALIVEKLAKRSVHLDVDDDKAVQKRITRSSSKGRSSGEIENQSSQGYRVHGITDIPSRRVGRALSEGRILNNSNKMTGGKTANRLSLRETKIETASGAIYVCGVCSKSWKRRNARATNYMFQRFDYFKN